MFERTEMLNMARALTAYSDYRGAVIARNVANSDTPGFRAADLVAFAESYRNSAASDLRTSHKAHRPQPVWAQGDYRPAEMKADISPNGNSVSLEEEMYKLAQLKREHDISLGVYRAALDLMRTSIGHRA